jgi:protein-disulfide isomerase
VADEEERDEAQGREGDEAGGGEESREREDASEERDESSDGDRDSDDDSDDGDDDTDDGDSDDGDSDDGDDGDDDDGDDEPEDKTDYLDDDEQRRIAAARKNAEATEKRHERADKEARERDESRQESRRKRLKLLGIALGIAVLIVLIGVLISTCSGEAEKKAGEQTAPVIGSQAVQQRFAGIPQEGFSLGQEDAPVRIVEFADLQCPFCKEAADTSLPVLIDSYVKPGKVRLEFRNFAILGPDSEKAARAAQAAADQGKAWQFIDLWYLNQGEENTGYVTDDFIRRIAKGVPGLDAEAVVKASNGAEQESLAEARTEAQKFGIDETPSYLIGPADGELRQLQVQDARNAGLFIQAIDRQLGQTGG